MGYSELYRSEYDLYDEDETLAGDESKLVMSLYHKTLEQSRNDMPKAAIRAR